MRHENDSNCKGWVTEKIFDSMQAGIVPVYWGAPNIEKYVDPRAFIDRRKFKTEEELAHFLTGMTREEYETYLEAARNYMQSEEWKKFLPEAWCDIMIQALEK